MKQTRKVKPWAKPQEPAKRKKRKGLKLPIQLPEQKQFLRELDDSERRLNAWASGEPLEVEDRFQWIDPTVMNLFNMGFSNPARYINMVGTRKTFYDQYMGIWDTKPEPVHDTFPWRDFLKTIPDLKGQIIGSHTIVWGHKLTFKKFTDPILNRYGDVLSENAGMSVRCECGWMEKDILPRVTSQSFVPQNITSGFLAKPQVDFQLVEKVIMEHIQGTFEELEYIVIPLEFLEDIPDGFRKALLELLKNSGAVMQFEYDTRNYLIIDDAMSDEAIAELTEMLAGYEVGTRKVRVLRP